MSQPDDPRDAHLVAALRHAPDRDVAPPAQLSAAILGQAQQALRARRPAPASAWRALWAQLWQPAPMAAFGTLAMATLIGVMWSTQEAPEATPSLRPEAVAVAPAAPLAEVAPAASTVPTPAPALSSAERDQAVRSEAAREPAERAPGPAPVPRSAKAEKSSAVARRSADAATAEPEARLAAAAGKAAESAATTLPPAAPPPPAPLVRQAAPQEPEGQREAFAKSMADAAPAAARARNDMAAVAPAPATTLGTARPLAASPLAAADIAAAMAGDAARVRWRVAADRPVAHEAAQRDWWSALARGTQGRWQPADGTFGSGAEAAAVTLLIDGALRGRLVFEPQALVWRDANGAAWRAPVEPSQGREWQEALGRW
jgi:hypothetical protein